MEYKYFQKVGWFDETKEKHLKQIFCDYYFRYGKIMNFKSFL